MSHTPSCVSPPWAEHPHSIHRVTIDVTRWIDSIRFVKRSRVDARCREGTRGAGFLNPTTTDSACARRAEVETKVRDWWSGVAAVFRRIVFAAAARVGRKRPIRRRVASRGTRVDRSLDRSRSVGRGVAWVTGGGARSTEGRAAAVRVSVRVPLRRTRPGVGRASSRVESMDGTNASRTHRERAATRGVDLARRRSGTRE